MSCRSIQVSGDKADSRIRADFPFARIQFSPKKSQAGAVRTSVLLLAIVGSFLIQWGAGRLMLWSECSKDDLLVLNPRPAAVSLARTYDVSDDAAFKSCGELCFRSLLHPTNRMQFVETFVDTPNPDALSEKRGWYRYEVLEAGDERCGLFVKSKSARKEFDETAKAIFGPSVQAGKRCVGATFINKPVSTVFRESRTNNWKKVLFGVVVDSLELRDVSSETMHAKRKFIHYRGSFLYLMITALYVEVRSNAYCDDPLMGLSPTQSEFFSPVSNLPPVAF